MSHGKRNIKLTKEQTSESLEPEKEWTLKKIIVRLIMYPFCIFLIVLGVNMFFKPINYKTQSAGIGAIVIASVYLYSDLLIITKRENVNSKW